MLLLRRNHRNSENFGIVDAAENYINDKDFLCNNQTATIWQQQLNFFKRTIFWKELKDPSFLLLLEWLFLYHFEKYLFLGMWFWMTFSLLHHSVLKVVVVHCKMPFWTCSKYGLNLKLEEKGKNNILRRITFTRRLRLSVA